MSNRLESSELNFTFTFPLLNFSKRNRILGLASSQMIILMRMTKTMTMTMTIILAMVMIAILMVFVIIIKSIFNGEAELPTFNIFVLFNARHNWTKVLG